MIYVDYANSAPVLHEAVEAMLPFLREEYGNPQARHSMGRRAHSAVEAARGQVATLLGAEPQEVVFCASGSEANTLAIHGAARPALIRRLTTHGGSGVGRHLITSRIEHASVAQAVKTLEREGFEATVLPVDHEGCVAPQAVEDAIRPDTALVSIQHASTDIGTIQSIAEIGRVTRARGILFHTDAVASAGLVPLDVEALGVDLLTLAAQTFYGPKGAAALYVRRGVRLRPVIEGGIQERGRRAGTENVPALVGMGVAAEVARREGDSWASRMTGLRDRLLTGLDAVLDRTWITGSRHARLPHHASLAIEYVDGEALTHLLERAGIAAASGSSCTPSQLRTSQALLALGLPPEVAQGALLLTLGKDTTMAEVETILEVLPPLVERLRRLSPVYTAATSGR